MYIWKTASLATEIKDGFIDSDFFLETPINNYVDNWKSSVLAQCPGSQLDEIISTEQRVVIESNYSGCSSYEGEKSVRAFIKGEDGIYHLSYDVKPSAFDQNIYDKWKESVVLAELISNPFSR